MRLGALVLASVLGTGCGLISSDVTSFNLDLPDKRFAIDTASWDVDPQMAKTALNTPCSSASQCMTIAQSACAMDCSGTCTAAMRCSINLDVGLHTSINLLMEKPELQRINDRGVVEVTVDDVLYTIEENTLNVDTPEIGVFVAPSSVMDPGDSLAKRIGTISPVAAGDIVEARSMMFTPDGRNHLSAVMGNFKAPFNVIVGSTLTMTGSDPVPEGRLDAVIRIRARAGI
ncbi:MAG TPA: hypothetical protein VK427_02710 [Kofleriaceae bacterium]|nr:hypothetical protein [Kofleriaceae bacterium]